MRAVGIKDGAFGYDGYGESEVGDDSVAMLVDEHVLGFDVAMHDAEAVDGLDAEELKKTTSETRVRSVKRTTHHLGSVEGREWDRQLASPAVNLDGQVASFIEGLKRCSSSVNDHNLS